MGTIRQVIIYNSHLVVMVLEKGIVDHISASRVGLLLFWWKRKMKMNSSKLHLLNIKRKETKSERYMVRDTQTWSKSITLKILSLSLGTLSTPERWPDFSSFSNIALERHNRQSSFQKTEGLISQPGRKFGLTSVLRLCWPIEWRRRGFIASGPFFSFFLMRKPLSSGPKWFLRPYFPLIRGKFLLRSGLRFLFGALEVP